jgi:hypothetical protein
VISNFVEFSRGDLNSKYLKIDRPPSMTAGSQK